MNTDHLRKQAKNLVKIFPDLVAANPSALPLAVAQSAIARINGFPSWEILVSKQQAPRQDHGNQAAAASTTSAPPASLSIFIYLKIDEDESDLVAAYSSTTGDPSRYRKGVEGIFYCKSAAYESVLEREDEQLCEAFETASPDASGDYDRFDKPTRTSLRTMIEESLVRCPYNVEAYAMLAGLWFADGDYKRSLAVVEPIATQLLAMIPTDRYIQISYGFLANRPFHRLMHNYVLSLSKVGRHKDATRHAKRMLELHPNDNIGFRGLTSRSMREDS